MAVSKKVAAASKSTAKQDVAGRRVAKKGEPQHAAYVEKTIPTRIGEFADWLETQTGYTDLDPRSVYLGSALRGAFQKSEENQERIAARAQEIKDQAEARAQAKIDRAAAKEQRAAERAEKAAAREAAKAEAAAEAKAAPAKKAPAKAAAKKAPAKAAPAKPTRRRPAKPAAADTDGDF